MTENKKMEKIKIIVKEPGDYQIIDFGAEKYHPGITSEGDATFCSIGVRTKKDGKDYGRYIIFPKSKIPEIIKLCQRIKKN